MRHEFQPESSSTGATPPHEFSFEKQETDLPEKVSTTEAREEKSDYLETYHIKDYAPLSPEKYASHFHIKACLDTLYRRVDNLSDYEMAHFASYELTYCVDMLEAMIDMGILSDELIDQFTNRFIRYRTIFDEELSRASQNRREIIVPQFNTLSIRLRYLLYRVGVVSDQEIQADVINDIANLIETSKPPLFDHPEKIIKILQDLNQTELADAAVKGALRSIEAGLTRDESDLNVSMELYEDLIRIYAVSQPTMHLAKKVLDAAFAHLEKFYEPTKTEGYSENYYEKYRRKLSRVRVRLWQLRDELGLPEQPHHNRFDLFESHEEIAWNLKKQLAKGPQPWNPTGPLAQAKFFMAVNQGGHAIIAEGLVAAGRATEAIDTINKLADTAEYTRVSIHLVRALQQAEIRESKLPLPASAPAEITNAPVVDHTMHREDEFQFNLPPVPDVSHLYPTDEHRQLAEVEAEKEWHRTIHETLSPKPVIPPDE